MENKRKSQYSVIETEKRKHFIAEILDELSEENLNCYTTEFLSDLVKFVEDYGFED